VGVADIMKRAGLTHGGFYAHFASRDALVAEALERAGQESRERLQQSIETAVKQPGTTRFRALVESYLSDRHLRSAETGCPVAALASEMPRQSDDVRAVAAARVQSLAAYVRDQMFDGATEEDAMLVACQLVGALQLARALGDNAQGRKLLAVSRRALLE
jgi:TetR/AcrR family transcriptional repressor of nem operon